MEGKKSNYRGVYWHETCKKWVVSVWFNNERVKVGYFDDIIEGIKVLTGQYLCDSI